MFSFTFRATLLAAGMAAPALAATPVYQVTPVTGVSGTYGAVMNKWGQVAGFGASIAGPVLWTPTIANGATGKLISLAAQPGYPANANPGSPGNVAAMNDRGQVTGSADVSSGGDANGTVTYLFTPKTLNSTTGVLHGGGGHVTAFATVNTGSGPLAPYPSSINNAGQITAHGGYYNPELFTPTTPNTGAGNWAFDNSVGVTNLVINDAKQVAGGAYGPSLPVYGPTYGFSQSGFPPFAPASVLSSSLWKYGNVAVVAINPQGDLLIAAPAAADGNGHAYLSKSGVISDAGGNDEAFPLAINDSDMVTGGRVENGGGYAYISSNGTVADLQTLVPPTLNGQNFTVTPQPGPVSINHSGQILVTGGDGVGDGLFILTPAANIIGKQPVVTSGAIHPAGAGLYKRTVKVTNSTTATLAAPVSVAFDRLANATLPAAPTTLYAGPAGSPYVDITANALAPGASATLTVTFSAASPAFTYKPRVLAGPSQR